jgi:hypothetical protein
MDMRIGLWNVRSSYGAGSPMTVPNKLSKYKLQLAGLQEVRWEGGGTEPAGEYTLFYRKGNEIHDLGTGPLCIRVMSPVKKIEFVKGRMSYIILRGRWCHCSECSRPNSR